MGDGRGPLDVGWSPSTTRLDFSVPVRSKAIKNGDDYTINNQQSSIINHAFNIQYIYIYVSVTSTRERERNLQRPHSAIIVRDHERHVLPPE